MLCNYDDDVPPNNIRQYNYKNYHNTAFNILILLFLLCYKK